MKTKKILLTIVLFSLITFVSAQDKYDFAIIEFRTFMRDISISINGKEYLVEKAEYQNQDKTITNANPFLIKVNEYQDKGWEVMSFTSPVGGNNTSTHIAYLRKKRADK